MTMLQPQRAGIPLPQPTPISQPFWDGCAVGELRYQRCAQCGAAEFDPTWVCRHCGEDALNWCVSGGRGEVYSHAVVWRPQTPEFDAPYAVVIVTYDEGFRMLTNLIGCPVDEVRIGLRVQTEFHAVGVDVTLPYVKPDVSGTKLQGHHGN
jgi:uncharacterized protein